MNIVINFNLKFITINGMNKKDFSIYSTSPFSFRKLFILLLIEIFNFSCSTFI